ncbi:hypothetical protein Tco_0713837, partial [Tanacetum coccineum]
MDENRRCSIMFEVNDNGTMIHIGPNAAMWSNLVSELIGEFQMYYPKWQSIELDRRVHIMPRLM